MTRAYVMTKPAVIPGFERYGEICAAPLCDKHSRRQGYDLDEGGDIGDAGCILCKDVTYEGMIAAQRFAMQRAVADAQRVHTFRPMDIVDLVGDTSIFSLDVKKRRRRKA